MTETTTEYVVTGEIHPPVTVALSNRGNGVFLKQVSSWIRVDLEAFDAIVEAVDALTGEDSEPELGKLHKHPRPEVTTPAKWGR